MAAINYEDARIYFRTLDNIPSGSNVSYGDVDYLTHVIDATWTRRVNQIGDARASFYMQDDWYQLAQEGRVASVVLPIEGEIFDRLIAQFVVKTMRVRSDAEGRESVEITGSGLEWRATRTKVWVPIGEENALATTVDVAILAPWTTALAVGAPANNDSATLDSVADIEVGDEVRIQMDNESWHVATVTGVGGGLGTNRITYTPRIPENAAVDNDVELRKANITVDDASGMGEGQRVEIELDDASTQVAYLLDVDTTLNTLLLDRGVTDSAAIANDVIAYDYSQPATNDVTQVVDASGYWTVDFTAGNGSLTGSAHVPQGESVYDLLLTIAERTGELFRYVPLPGSGFPRWHFAWRHTPDSSGVTLVGYSSSSSDYTLRASREGSGTYGVMYSLRSAREKALVTRVYALSGDQQISLGACSAFALSYAASEGCEVVLGDTDDYQPDYVQSTIDDDDGVWEEVVTYGDVSLSDASTLDELQSAADNLLYAAVATIRDSRARQYYEVEAFTPLLIHPGQTVKLENRSATRLPSVNSSTNWVVLEVTETIVNGRPRTRLLVSDVSGLRANAATTYARAARAQTQSLKRIGSGGGSLSVSTTVTGDGGEPGEHDHDDDYLALSTYATHVATAHAHHSPASAGNSALSVASQAISVVRRADSGLIISSGLGIQLQDGSGLALAGDGLAIASSLAGDGLYFAAGRVMHVDVTGHSGLQIYAGGLQMGTPTGVSATSVNNVNASSHTHAVASDSTAVDEASKLLKSGGGGELSLARVGAGVASTSSAVLYARAKATSQHTLMIKQLSGQTGDMLRVENPAGDELVVMRGDGSLESGSPRFVSGQTGWRLSPAGDFEANNGTFRGELSASFFSAKQMSVTGGTLAVMNGGKVANPDSSDDNRLPTTLNSTMTLRVDADADTGLARCAMADVLRIKTIGEIASGASLDLYDVYLEVTSAPVSNGDRDLSEGLFGTYDVACVWRSGGEPSWEIPAGSAYVVWTKVAQGSGSYEGALLLTSDADDSPYVDVSTIDANRNGAWPGSGYQRTPPTQTPRVRMGNLNGLMGNVEDTWGIAFGDDLSSSDVSKAYGTLSSGRNEFANLDFYFRESGEEKLAITTSGGVTVRADATDQFVRGFRFYDYGDARVVGSWDVKRVIADGVSLRYDGALSIGSTFSTLPAIGGVVVYAGINKYAQVDLRAESASGYAQVSIYADDATDAESVTLRGDYVEIEDAPLRFDTDASRTTIVDARASDIAHGMTSPAPSTNTFATLEKQSTSDGGLKLAGFSKTQIGAQIAGYATTEYTTRATTSRAAVVVNSLLKSGTGVSALQNNANIFAVMNNGVARFFVTGVGNVYWDGSGTSFDAERDVDMTRAVELALTDRLDETWERMLAYRRSDLERAGLVEFADDGSRYVNASRMQRLLAGAVFELASRLSAVESALAGQVAA